MAHEWRTEDELEYIDHLGKNGNRLRALESYRTVARRRQDWGSIDAARILRFVEIQICIETLQEQSHHDTSRVQDTPEDAD